MTAACPVDGFIRDLNRCWLEDRVDELEYYFHEDAYLVAPGGTIVKGRAAILDGYRQFLSAAAMHSFEVVGTESAHFEGLVVVHLTFHIDYEMNGERYREQGMDVYAVSTHGPDPLVVWRTQLSLE